MNWRRKNVAFLIDRRVYFGCRKSEGFDWLSAVDDTVWTTHELIELTRYRHSWTFPRNRNFTIWLIFPTKKQLAALMKTTRETIKWDFRFHSFRLQLAHNFTFEWSCKVSDDIFKYKATPICLTMVCCLMACGFLPFSVIAVRFEFASKSRNWKKKQFHWCQSVVRPGPLRHMRNCALWNVVVNSRL